MSIKEFITLVLKGMGMGVANVIPGVSGGTIALITGIFERLIQALKSFNLKAVQLLFSFKLKEFSKHIDLLFLVAVFSGIAASIISIAKLFEYLFANYPVYIWAYFFGLILASVYFVGKTISKWSLSVILVFMIGTAIAVLISFLNPASANDSFFYLIICGVVAICSMILPGLSGSFVLILMGNYELVMIDAVSNMNIRILTPVAIGAAGGLIAFSYFLSWIFKKFRDQTIAVLTGFILGSVIIIWPWKHVIYRLDSIGNILVKDGEQVVQGYRPFFPTSFNMETLIAFAIIILGVISIWLVEKTAEKKN